MHNRKADHLWIPLWIDKWIFGSTRIECSLEERAVWIDFLALAGKDNGYIRASETIPYSIDQLAGLLIIPKDTLLKAIQTFLKTGKIEENAGIFKVKHWDDYSLSKRHKRRFMSEIKDSMPKKADAKSDQNKNKEDIYSPVIAFLNEKASTKYKASTPKTQALIKARQTEGFTLEDFKKVIELKVTQWGNDDKFSRYLRPETLFGTKFESYLNEQPALKEGDFIIK